MTDKQLEKLLDKHSKAQTKATYLYGKIIEELNNRCVVNENDVLSCLSQTEPEVWKEAILKLINKDKES